MKTAIRKKISFLILNFFLIATMIFFVPPINLLIIFLFITLTSLFLTQIVVIFTNKKYFFPVFIFFYILQTLLSLKLFDIINLSLTIALFLAIIFLLK